MSIFSYKVDGDLIRIGDEVLVPSISTSTRFIVNGYVTDEAYKPQHRVDLIAQPDGGDPVQLYVHIELIEKVGSGYTLGSL